MPVKEKLLDERQRSWLRPNTWSWELMLGIRKTRKGNTLKSQPLQHAIRMTVLYYSSCATWNGVPPPHHPLITQEMQASFQIQTWSCHHCAVSVLGSCSTQGRLPKSKGKLIRVNIKQGERSAAARGFCTPLNQVLTCKAFTGPFPSRTPAL